MNERIELADAQRRHMARVLRVSDGASVSYTNGAGRIGEGVLQAGRIVRGDEWSTTRGVPELTVAAVPLRDKHRTRFMVEKLAELGVAELTWIRSSHGQVPPTAKARAWADQAVEQSRSAWRMAITESVVAALPSPVVVTHPRGGPWPPRAPKVVVIGPEGGWAPHDLQPDWTPVTLGPRVLRSETAALVAASHVLTQGPNTTISDSDGLT